MPSKIPELDAIQKQTIINLWTKFVKMNEAHRRPALHYTFTEYENPEKGINDRLASKLGGLPFWPNDSSTFPYKRGNSEKDDKFQDASEDTSNMGDLRLLAQFNLSEIPLEQRRVLHLPEDGGILQFFISSENLWGLTGVLADYPSHETYRVKYWPEKVVLNTSECLPADKFPAISEKETKENIASGNRPLLPFEAHRPLQINFASEPVLESWSFSDDKTKSGFEAFLRQEAPEIMNLLTKKNELDHEWKDACIWTLIKERFGVEGRDPCSCSKLGGHATFTQEDPRGFWREDQATQTLMQLDSHGAVNIENGGVMNFFNDEPRTSRGEFELAKYNWDHPN